MDQERLGQTNDILRRVALALERLAPNQQTTQNAIDALLKIGITDSGTKSDKNSGGGDSKERGSGRGRGRDDEGDEEENGGKGPPKVPDQSPAGMLKGLGPAASRLLGAGESLMPGLGLGQIGGTISKMVNLLSAFDGAKEALGRMGLLGDDSQKLGPPELPKSALPIPLAPPSFDRGPIHAKPPDLPGSLPSGEESIPLASPPVYPLLTETPASAMPPVAADGKTKLGGPRNPDLPGPQAPHTTLAPSAYKDEVSDAGADAIPLAPSRQGEDIPGLPPKGYSSNEEFEKDYNAYREPEAWQKMLRSETPPDLGGLYDYNAWKRYRKGLTVPPTESMNSPDLLGPLRPIGTVGSDLSAAAKGGDDIPILNPQSGETASNKGGEIPLLSSQSPETASNKGGEIPLLSSQSGETASNKGGEIPLLSSQSPETASNKGGEIPLLSSQSPETVGPPPVASLGSTADEDDKDFGLTAVGQGSDKQIDQVNANLEEIAKNTRGQTRQESRAEPTKQFESSGAAQALAAAKAVKTEPLTTDTLAADLIKFRDQVISIVAGSGLGGGG